MKGSLPQKAVAFCPACVLASQTGFTNDAFFPPFPIPEADRILTAQMVSAPAKLPKTGFRLRGESSVVAPLPRGGLNKGERFKRR